MSRTQALGAHMSAWARGKTIKDFDEVRAALSSMWPFLQLRPTSSGSKILVEDAAGVAFVEIYLKAYRSRQTSAELLASALVVLDALNEAARPPPDPGAVELVEGDRVIKTFPSADAARNWMRLNPMAIIQEARGQSVEEFMADAGIRIRETSKGGADGQESEA